MQTKIGAVVGTMILTIGIIISFVDPQTHMSGITQDFLNDTNPVLWAILNGTAGIALMIPGHHYSKARHYYAAIVTALWVIVALWPGFTDGPTDRISPIGVTLWVGLTVLIIMDSHSPVFDKDYQHFHPKYDNNIN